MSQGVLELELEYFVHGQWGEWDILGRRTVCAKAQGHKPAVHSGCSRLFIIQEYRT